jgi:hypothetical protein
LPYNEEGWWVFPSGQDIGINVLSPSSVNVGLQVVLIRN